MTERVVGRVARAHGLRGEVAIDVLTSIPDQRFVPGARLLEVEGERVFTVATVRRHQQRLLVGFAEVPDRTAAELLRGVLLSGESDAPAPEGEMWAEDLEGYTIDVDGRAVGVVEEVMESPAHDLLVVRKPDGGEALVPLVEHFVTAIDETSRVIHLDPPEGLI